MGLRGYKQQEQHASSKCMLAFFLSSSCFFPLSLIRIVVAGFVLEAEKNVNLCLGVAVVVW